MKLRFFGWLLASITLGPLASAQLSEVCQKDEQQGYAYCIHTTSGSSSLDVLYYFHGITDTERSWVDGPNVEFRAGMRKAWEDAKLQAPTVVTISLGSAWLLNDKYFEAVSERLMPLIEQKHLAHLTGERLLMGVSMGGFNALQMMFKKPGTFSRAAILSPLIPICDPWLDERALHTCIAKDPFEKNHYAAYQAHELVREYFYSRSDWENHNPLAVGQSKLGPATIPMILSTGMRDAFGFFSTSLRLAKIGEGNKAPVTWEPTYLEHAQYDYKKVALYLLGVETPAE